MKAVVFDFGRVISLSPEASDWDAIAAVAGLDAKTLEPFIWRLRDEYDRGSFSCMEYYRSILNAAGVKKNDECIAEMARLDTAAWTRINPATVRLMEDVKKEGYTLGILSNMSHDFLAWGRANCPVFRLPDMSVFSCEEGSIKPERAIYETLLARLRCPASDVIFFDDVAVNGEKARELGVKAYIWKDANVARASLREQGIFL
jgi:putative hydrolase of the HAD superfamily